MYKTAIITLLMILLNSCASYRKTENGYEVKGKTRVVFNGIETNLNNMSAISGYVYSKSEKEFIEEAYVELGDQKITTDKNGYFNAIIEPGIYSISTNFIGNNEEKITNLRVEKNNRIIIFFELGADVIRCK